MIFLFLIKLFKLQLKWKLLADTSTLGPLTHPSVRIMLVYPIRSLSPGSGLVSSLIIFCLMIYWD